MLAPQACEIWRRRRACQAESTPRSFLHAYLCARSSGDVHAHIAYGMWMRWVNFPCKSLALLGLYTSIDYMPRSSTTLAVAHMIQIQREEGWARRILLLLLPPARPTARKRANGVRPCHGHAQHYHLHVNITRCVVWRCVSADRRATHLRDPHAVVHPGEPNAINRTPTIVRRRDGRACPLSRAVVWWWHTERGIAAHSSLVMALCLACGSPCAFWPGQQTACDGRT